MPNRHIRKWLLRIIASIALVTILGAGATAIFLIRCSSVNADFARLPADHLDPHSTAGLQAYSRPQEDTYFSYPEWYIVWSYQEKSDFQRDHLPSGFPFFGAIGQYWQAYCWANSMANSGHYPVNFGDHLMLMVIGSSFTVEYALKGAYEKTVGRFMEWTSGGRAVPEDVYAARVAKEYADFVHIRPFYEFSFAKSLSGLWRETPWMGPHLLRKWERRIFLSLDYGIEAIYCGVLTGATHAVYGVEPADTYAFIENAPTAVLTQIPHIRLVRQLTPNAAMVIIPRYQEFADTAMRLASSGVRFADIAGNSEVLVSALLPSSAVYDIPGSQLVFSSALLTDSTRRRAGIRCAVSHLNEVLTAMTSRGLRVEHIYDY